MVATMRRSGALLAMCVAGGLALVLVGCSAPTTATPTASSASADADKSRYEMRLGRVVAGAEPDTLKAEFFIPAFSSGLWLRFSAIEGTTTRDVCQVVVEDVASTSQNGCSVEAVEREDGDLRGVVLVVDGLPDTGYFELDSRELRRTEEGGWSGETSGRSVKVWGFLKITEASK